MSRFLATSWIASLKRHCFSGVSGTSSPGATTRLSRPVAKSETTTRSPETTKAAPPYSWTRERVLNPSGVIRVSLPSFSRRIRTWRPPSSGRPSIHQRTPAAARGSARKTTRSVSRSILNGETQDPYGATVTPAAPEPRRSVVVTRLGSVLPRRHVFGLLRCQRIELDPEGGELEPGDLGVDRRRDAVDLMLQLGVVLHGVLGRKRLVGEAHVHYRGRMALGGAEVHQPALGD